MFHGKEKLSKFGPQDIPVTSYSETPNFVLYILLVPETSWIINSFILNIFQQVMRPVLTLSDTVILRCYDIIYACVLLAIPSIIESKSLPLYHQNHAKCRPNAPYWIYHSSHSYVNSMNTITPNDLSIYVPYYVNKSCGSIFKRDPLNHLPQQP